MPGFIVKAKYNGECRRFPVKESQLIYSYLDHEIRARFNIPVKQPISILFTDGNTMNVPIRNDSELNFYCKTKEKVENTLIRFKIVDLNSPLSTASTSSVGIAIPPQSPPIFMDDINNQFQIQQQFQQQLQQQQFQQQQTTSTPTTSTPTPQQVDFLSFWKTMSSSIADMVKSVEAGQSKPEDAMKQSFTSISQHIHQPQQQQNQKSNVTFDLTNSTVVSSLENSQPIPTSSSNNTSKNCASKCGKFNGKCCGGRTLSNNPDFIRIHAGVICDNCETRIVGIRYKCGHCIDFDLCDNCETLNPHRSDHLLIKIKEPIVQDAQSPYWAKMPLLPPLPKLKKSTTVSHPIAQPIVCQPPQQQPRSIPFFSTQPIQQQQQPKPKPVVQVPVPEKAQYVIPHSGRFISDVTIQDGLVMQPGQEFFKTWEMHNNGKFSWQLGTRLVYVGGDVLSEETSFVVPLAAPGEKVNITVPMKTPMEEGRYTSYWRLVNPTNQTRFGDRVWCDIIVAKPIKPTREINIMDEELPSFESLSLINKNECLVDVSDPNSTQTEIEVEEEEEEEEAPEYVEEENNYRSQLSQLNDMGFFNQELNNKLLLQYKGDVNQVIPILLEQSDNNWFTSRNFVHK